MGTPSPHLLDLDQLGRPGVEAILSLAADIERHQPRHDGAIVAALFFEPSTRTRLSFESASIRLGCGVIGFSDPGVSSVRKGESLIDTIRVVESYADLIVIRHPCRGAARLAADVASVPIINAGDGSNEHPTQALFDVFTIQREFGDLSGLRVGMIGDLGAARSAHSFASAVRHFDVELTLITPERDELPRRWVESLSSSTRVSFAERLRDVVEELDVLYVTREQIERRDGGRRSRLPDYPITRDALPPGNRPIVLHPLPRAGELSYDVDADPRARYFQQARNGVPVRMAVLHAALERSRDRTIAPPGVGGGLESSALSCPEPQCVTHHERALMLRVQGGRCYFCGADVAG